jgi:hypothetical protein
MLAGEIPRLHPDAVCKSMPEDAERGLTARILQGFLPEGMAKACEEAVQQPACIKHRWGCCCQWCGLQIHSRLSVARRSVRSHGCWHRRSQALGLQMCHAHAGECVAAEAARKHLHVQTVRMSIGRWRVHTRLNAMMLILGVSNNMFLTFEHSKQAHLAGRRSRGNIDGATRLPHSVRFPASMPSRPGREAAALAAPPAAD